MTPSPRPAGRRRPFVVDITALSRGADPLQLRREGTCADLSVSGAHVDPDATVAIEARLESVHEGILVTGTVTAPYAGECRRCLEPATGIVEVAVTELCTEAADGESTYALSAQHLDLEPIVHDACILNLPLAPLCRADCLGLCPRCGANLNTERCSCGPAVDPRWQALAVFAGGAPEAQGQDG